MGKETGGLTAAGKRCLIQEKQNDSPPKRPKSAEGKTSANEQVQQCPYCTYSSKDANRMQLHIMSQHSVQPVICCPLCQDVLSNKIHLQLHLTHLHSVAPDCVEKLIMTLKADTEHCHKRFPMQLYRSLETTIINLTVVVL
ncbi:zinc finger homeobox protein 4-like [Osmerus eperlanus]|uniref:zinc finger homeobox protein 4-like n=1 Tax=Osmerus eperlanus TaxID=29151 RepID=UPI002E11B108